jgi:hypothetical protein
MKHCTSIITMTSMGFRFTVSLPVTTKKSVRPTMSHVLHINCSNKLTDSFLDSEWYFSIMSCQMGQEDDYTLITRDFEGDPKNKQISKSCKFDDVHFLCNCVIYMTFNINLLHRGFYLLITAQHVLALAVGHLQGARKYFSTCSLCLNLCLTISTYEKKLLIWRLNIASCKISLQLKYSIKLL